MRCPSCGEPLAGNADHRCVQSNQALPLNHLDETINWLEARIQEYHNDGVEERRLLCMLDDLARLKQIRQRVYDLQLLQRHTKGMSQ